MRLKRIVEISYDNPYDSTEDGFNWLCNENIEMVLRSACKNANINVKSVFLENLEEK